MESSKLVGRTILLLVLIIATGLRPAQAQCKGKQSWPELVGFRGCRAAAIIERQNKYVDTIVLPVNSTTTRDFRCDRVWVFIDHTGSVAKTPIVT